MITVSEGGVHKNSMRPDTTLTIRLTNTLKNKLITEAKQSGFSLSEYLRLRLADTDDTYVLQDKGDVLLRYSDLSAKLLERLRRTARGQLRDKTVKSLILMYLAKGIGVPVNQLRRE
jgi:hypothetical protein